MFYTYSTHKTRDAALDAIEQYFNCAEISECDDPRVVRLANGRWAVEIRDNLYAY